MAGPEIVPATPERVETAPTRSPSLELWVALLFGVLPQAAAVFVGGYGQIITNAPLAVIVTIIEVIAVVIAYLQFREDAHASRSTHWLVWATIAVGGLWLLYALFVGMAILLGQIFCISKEDRKST